MSDIAQAIVGDLREESERCSKIVNPNSTLSIVSKVVMIPLIIKPKSFESLKGINDSQSR